MTARTPPHLRPDTKRWFESVLADYELDEHHVRLLTLACEAFDRAVAASEIIRREGLVVDGPRGMRLHPAVAIERDARIGFARLVRELDLDCAAPPEAARPPALMSNRRRR